MVELNIYRIPRNAQILKFATDQENFALGRSRHFRGRLLEARRKPRYNAVGGHHIEDVQTLDRGGRMSCVDCLAVFLLHASRDMRVSPPEGNNFVDPKGLNVRTPDATGTGQRDSRLNFNHTLDRTREFSAQSMSRCVVVKFRCAVIGGTSWGPNTLSSSGEIQQQN